MAWTFTTPTTISGYTFSGAVPYSGLAVGANGTTTFQATLSTSVDQGTFDVAVHHGGTWYVWSNQNGTGIQPISTGFPKATVGGDGTYPNQRANYFHILPFGSGAGAYIVASQDAQWSELGYQRPTGMPLGDVMYTYTYNAVKMWYSTDWTSVAPTEVPILYHTTQGNTSGNYWVLQAYAQNAWYDPISTKSYALILYSNGQYVLGGSAATGQLYLATIGPQNSTPTAVSAVATTGTFGFSNNDANLLLDGTGHPWVMTNDGGGTWWIWDSTVLTSGGGTPQTLTTTHSPASTYSYFAKPASGSSLSDTVDMLFGNGGTFGTSVIWVRLHYNRGTTNDWSITNEEVIVSGLTESTDVGNVWGWHKNRITRTPDGTLYATAADWDGSIIPGTGTYPLHTQKIYQRQGTNNWVLLDSRYGALEPTNIVNGGNGRLFIESNSGSSGFVQTFQSASDGSTPPVTTRRRSAILIGL